MERFHAILPDMGLIFTMLWDFIAYLFIQHPLLQKLECTISRREGNEDPEA